jgi:ribulose 1,5-bisphosphate carboxylase large subunit-like protein
MNTDIIVNSVDYDKYVIVWYYLESTKSLYDAAWNLAIGQSVGNPNVRNDWETQELYDNHAAKILRLMPPLMFEEHLKKNKGTIAIAFPLANIDWENDGVSQLLCFIMGGQLDIDSIVKCHVEDIWFPDGLVWNEPKYGIEGIRKFTGVYEKPLLGGIVKPKTGISPSTLLDMVKEMCDNGVNFIKEDEIMANPQCCQIKDRAQVIIPYLQSNHPKVIYSFCVNSDYPQPRVSHLVARGANSVHVNFWSGLGIYKQIRNMDYDIFIHFQKSGDKILTNPSHAFHIKWPVICKLAGMMGVDFIHAGMWGGYSSNDEGELHTVMDTLHEYRVMPALSCGMHPGIVNKVTEKFGVDYMANVGGALHGHPGGTGEGVKAMRQAIDGNFGEAYKLAIEKWGFIE